MCRSSVEDMATVIGPPVNSDWCLCAGHCDWSSSLKNSLLLSTWQLVFICRSSVKDTAIVIGPLHSRVSCYYVK